MTPKLQEGNVIKQDNIKVVRPEIHERIKVTPRQYSLVDLGGTPSTDSRTAAERNKDYLHPIKGAKDRFKASMVNETNPLVGLERTVLPAAAGAALITTPATVIGGVTGSAVVDKMTGGWGNWLEDKTGIPSEIGNYTNPGAIYGGVKGYHIDKNQLASKFVKGDADLAWNPINKNHWIFNKEARTPTNVGMAVANRIAPFLQGAEKLPMKTLAYQAAKRTKGNASVSASELKANPSDYSGASILGGGSLEGRNLLAQYIFGENPLIKRAFFKDATKNIKPISGNEARRSFSHGERYNQLYPGLENRRYQMRSVVPQGHPLKFKGGMEEFIEYAGENPIGKVVGKEGSPVMRLGEKEFMTFREPGTNYVGPIDDVGGHLVKFQFNKGKLKQTSQDLWKFNPADYTKRWSGEKSPAEAIRLTKQAALMDKSGTPFILQQSNPVWFGKTAVREPMAMKKGGQFTFKKSPAVKDAEELNGKRDMRKKFVKSSRPTYKRRVKKAQEGIKFATYTPVEVNQTDYRDLTSIDNPFNEFNFATTYDKPTALVVPETTETKNEVETKSEPVVVNNPTPPVVVNKPTQNVSTSTTWRSPYKDKAKWTKDLSDAYRKVGITNDNAIRMLLAQDALESDWGKSAQGKYNFGNLTTGSSWKGNYVVGNDKNAKGEAIKQKFRAYESMDDYAKDKIQFLKRLYGFDENDDINKFVAKLTGSNKGKRKYAEAGNYAKLLTGVYNGIPKGENGMIVKYQEPAQGVQRRDNTYVQSPIDRIPITRTDENGKPWNELSTMERARLNVRQGRNPVTSKPIARGNLEITSPEFDILAGVRGLPLGKVGEMAEQGLAKSGNRWARNRVVGRAISNSEIKTPTQSMPNNVG